MPDIMDFQGTRSMNGKVYIILAYALIGIALALWPLCLANVAATASSEMPAGRKWPAGTTGWKTIALLIVALAAMYITGESIASPLVLTFGLVAVGASISIRRFDLVAMLTAFVALCISATLLWWVRGAGAPVVSDYALLAFFLLTSAVIRLIDSRTAASGDGFPVFWVAIYACLAASLAFSTGVYDDWISLRNVWHHWGALVGPAELLRSGAAIFHDFPAQYGLGPTAVIASFCGQDCWHAMYFVAGSTIFAYSVLIAVMAFALTRNRWPERIAVLILCLAVCFIWSGFPDHLGSPLTTPAVSGVRFLPATMLLTYLFFARDIEHSKKKVLVAQGLWALGVLWSPESAFYVTFLWWPYYLFVRRVEGDPVTRLKGAVKAAVILLATTAAFVVAFDAVYLLVYREQPTLHGILAYAINPPGPMPINWHGAIWYFLLATATCLGTLWCLWKRSGDTPAFRRAFLVLLLSYGASSYFLGRSHDNNLLNLLPLFLLVLLGALPEIGDGFLSRTRIVLAATLIGWLPVFGWQVWERNAMPWQFFQFDSRLADKFVNFRPDALRAIDYISAHYGEPVTVLDDTYDLVRSTPPDPWSAIHGSANFAFIPSAERREFLVRTAATLKRTGWVVVDRAFPAADWLADFDFAYQRVGYLDFGRYYAIRYSPKPAGGLDRQ